MGSSSQCVHRLMTLKIFCWCTTFCRWSLISLVWHLNSSDLTPSPLTFVPALLHQPPVLPTHPFPGSGHSLDLWSGPFLHIQVFSWAEIPIFLCLFLLAFITCPKHPLLFPNFLVLAGWPWCLPVMPPRHLSSLWWLTIAEWGVCGGSQNTVGLQEPCYLIIPACPGSVNVCKGN